MELGEAGEAKYYLNTRSKISNGILISRKFRSYFRELCNFTKMLPQMNKDKSIYASIFF